MSTLVKTRSVLGLLFISQDGSKAIYDNADDDEGIEATRRLTIDRVTFEDFGRPSEVTVIIEPRDTLNDAGEV